jgi:hypothetical protein
VPEIPVIAQQALIFSFQLVFMEVQGPEMVVLPVLLIDGDQVGTVIVVAGT